MKPKKSQNHPELFRSQLSQIINLEHALVRLSKRINWQRQRFYVSQVLAGEYIALLPYADGVWEMYYRFHLLGQMHDRERKIQPSTHWQKQEEM